MRNMYMLTSTATSKSSVLTQSLQKHVCCCEIIISFLLCTIWYPSSACRFAICAQQHCRLPLASCSSSLSTRSSSHRASSWTGRHTSQQNCWCGAAGLNDKLTSGCCATSTRDALGRPTSRVRCLEPKPLTCTVQSQVNMQPFSNVAD